jgi:hypothetical protein
MRKTIFDEGFNGLHYPLNINGFGAQGGLEPLRPNNLKASLNVL